MSFDLDLIQQLCREIGLAARIIDVDHLDIDLGEGAVLRFQNAKCESNCLIGFPTRGSYSWHNHEPFLFGNKYDTVELDYLDLVVALKEGQVLVCERQLEGRIIYRWLAHHEYIYIDSAFQSLQEGERVIVRRAPIAVDSNLESKNVRPRPNLRIVKTGDDR